MRNNFKKIIALEEHFSVPDKITKKYKMVPPSFSYAQDPGVKRRLLDIETLRISEMNEAGVDLQVLSLVAPGREQLEIEEAVAFSREVNDYIADIIMKYPERFAAFAALPIDDPEKAVDELERTVKQYNFKGTMISGNYKGRYLDDPFFEPLLQGAEDLGVPIYLHPNMPPVPVFEAYYENGLRKEVAMIFSTAGFGWHIDTAVHVLRMILAGVFDRHPKLQVIIGHLGEGISFFMERLDRVLPPRLTGLEKPISAYLKENVNYTISGFNFIPAFLDLYMHVGAERIMFSTDYPYSSMKEAVQFLNQLPISDKDKEKIAHENAERLMRF